MLLNGTNIVRKNKLYKQSSEIPQIIKSSEIPQNHPVPGRITKNQPNALATFKQDLNVVWFQFFTARNKIDRLEFTTCKAQFIWKK